MSEHIGPAQLIASLAGDLRPVRRLRPPMARALAWVAVVAVAAVLASQAADLHSVRERLFGAADMWLAAAGSALTAIFAAIAAFQLSVPGRSGRRWVALSLAAMLLWVGASGMGCLRAWSLPMAHDPSMGEERDCLYFILGVSAPLTALMLVMLRRAFPLWPSLTAGMAGLSGAGASASLLTFFHPFNPAATDIAMHALAVGVVIGLSRVLGGGWLGRR
ncbi:MAG: DUF1109 family protein [Acetobacteraceae bacterium]|nr:DUF1109 family protein [Acetobacteraceae bacterium]